MSKTVRKNLSGIGECDILLAHQYQTKDGKDVYSIHNVINYTTMRKPLGSITISPDNDNAVIERALTQKGRFVPTD